MLAATHDSMPGDKESMSSTDQNGHRRADLLLQKSEAVKKLISEYKSDKLSENGTFMHCFWL
jgi:hypothetical protein